MEAPGNDGTIRLVFKLADGIEVNGWALDVIAKYKAAQNVITVGWETYDPNDLETFALEGLVLYESVTVRQSSQGLKNEPAREVTVTAGGVPTDYYTKNGKLDSTVVRRAGETDRDGRFVLNGLQAIDGDRISILVSNNGVVQVEYRYLTNQRATEQSVCEEQQANPSTKSNDVVSVTRDCVVLDVTSDRVAGEDGQAGKTGCTLSDYILVTGDDGNTYLGWTQASSGLYNVGNEVWMSSYYSFNQAMRDDADFVDEAWAAYDKAVSSGDETAEEPLYPRNSMAYEGWSDPVMVTDFTTAMTETDRARYDQLIGKADATAEENNELETLGRKYGPTIDELAAVVASDSGALMLANTYTVSADETSGYDEKDYNLTAIRCIPDTSLEITDIQLTAAGDDASKVQVQDVSRNQLFYQIMNGDSSVGDDTWKSMASSDPGNHGKIIDLKVGESIQLDTVAFPHDSLKQVEYWDASCVLHVNDGVSADEAKSIVSVTNDGKVTALKEGVAVIGAADTSPANGRLGEAAARLVNAQGESIGMGLLSDISGAVLMDQVVTRVIGSAECKKDASCPISQFSHAKPTSWYHDGVHWALEQEIMNGKGAGLFEPEATATRAQLVTMLYRMESQPAVEAALAFTDVPTSKWYTAAVGWAAENGIVQGYGDGTFGQNKPLTREQLATILCRYAQYKGCDTSAGEAANLLGYTDAGQISRWAVYAGIINGVGDRKLSPKSGAQRAQVATMLWRFDNWMEE